MKLQNFLWNVNLFLTVLILSPDEQVQAVVELKTWLDTVSQVDLPPLRRAHFQQFKPSDVFIGFHDDAPASIVLRLGKELGGTKKNIIEKAKSIFLECATPDAISRLSETRCQNPHFFFQVTDALDI